MTVATPIRRPCVFFLSLASVTALTTCRVFADPAPIPSNWATITHARNRNPTPAEAPAMFIGDPAFIPGPRGAVDHEFRVTKTEMTYRYWPDFVAAYAGSNPGVQVGFLLTGRWMGYAGGDPGQPSSYEIAPQAIDYPVDVSWAYAARYVNWLHNGQVNQSWAFESGVYDLSGFNGPLGSALPERSPNARFWLPSLDEITKAAYYDPNRYGPNQEGYWTFPNASETPLVPGPVGMGDTLAGLGVFPDPPPLDRLYQPAGAYPDVASPWGLLDVSGTYGEWTDTKWNANSSLVYQLGTPDYGYLPTSGTVDVLGGNVSPFLLFETGSFRLAMAVPSPWTTYVVLFVPALQISQRKRRTLT